MEMSDPRIPQVSSDRQRTAAKILLRKHHLNPWPDQVTLPHQFSGGAQFPYNQQSRQRMIDPLAERTVAEDLFCGRDQVPKVDKCMNSMKGEIRPACCYYLQGKCTYSSCVFWHPPKESNLKNYVCKYGRTCSARHGSDISCIEMARIFSRFILGCTEVNGEFDLDIERCLRSFLSSNAITTDHVSKAIEEAKLEIRGKYSGFPKEPETTTTADITDRVVTKPITPTPIPSVWQSKKLFAMSTDQLENESKKADVAIQKEAEFPPLKNKETETKVTLQGSVWSQNLTKSEDQSEPTKQNIPPPPFSDFPPPSSQLPASRTGPSAPTILTIATKCPADQQRLACENQEPASNPSSSEAESEVVEGVLDETSDETYSSSIRSSSRSSFCQHNDTSGTHDSAVESWVDVPTPGTSSEPRINRPSRITTGSTVLRAEILPSVTDLHHSPRMVPMHPPILNYIPDNERNGGFVPAISPTFIRPTSPVHEMMYGQPYYHAEPEQANHGLPDVTDLLESWWSSDQHPVASPPQFWEVPTAPHLPLSTPSYSSNLGRSHFYEPSTLLEQSNQQRVFPRTSRS